MNRTPARTGATELKDAELLLFDFLFQHHARRRALARDEYSLHMNCSYSHALDSHALDDTLQSLMERGLISARVIDNPDDSWYALTADGGTLWESERLVDWSRYAMDWYGPSRTDSERHRVSIFGHSPSICRAFFDVGCRSGFFDYRGGRIATSVARRQLIYWRPEQPVHLLSAWLASWLSPTDWSYFEMKRSWWRFPADINRLWGWPSASDAPA